MLGDSSSEVRRAAIFALSCASDKNIPDLINALDSPTLAIRRGVEQVLKARGDFAVPGLTKALANPNPKSREYEGHITGFTMGTGQTLSLLPPQNATGNFVKIVQRLPVRIELSDYDPDKAPLFVGLSVEPRVYTKEPPTGPNAGAVLQPVASPPVGSPESRR
jgi:HEAT repeat protein